MAPVTCFWCQPTDEVQLYLRRYVMDDAPRPDGHCHSAMVPFRVEPARWTEHSDKSRSVGSYQDLAPPDDDPRWPERCACGESFKPDAPRQVFVDLLYQRTDDRGAAPLAIRHMPPGAMFDACWWPDKGPDGISLAVVLPPDGGDGNVWLVDAPPTWTRTGAVPKVTANPSILTPHYHGWLRDGALVAC